MHILQRQTFISVKITIANSQIISSTLAVKSCEKLTKIFDQKSYSTCFRKSSIRYGNYICLLHITIFDAIYRVWNDADAVWFSSICSTLQARGCLHLSTYSATFFCNLWLACLVMCFSLTLPHFYGSLFPSLFSQIFGFSPFGPREQFRP